jgi:cysteinyl-tRNA synthetase
MRLFNKQTQQLELFEPISTAATLCCFAPAPSETAQLGHAFLYCTADVLAHYLETKGWPVKYALIIAGVPDLALPGMRDMTEAWQPLMDQRMGRFAEHMRSLNMRSADYSSTATAGYETMIADRFGQPVDIYMMAEAEGDLIRAEPASGQALSTRFELQVAAVNQAQPGMDDPPGKPPTVDALLQRFSVNTIRIYLALHHYRSKWAHDEVLLEKAARQSKRLNAAMNAISIGEKPLDIAPAQNRFLAAMDKDLDTVRGLATLLNLADEILFRAANDYSIDGAQAALQQMASVLGLRLNPSS